MNRRHFLRSGSVAVIAAAGLPTALRAGKKQDPVAAFTYETKPEAGKVGQWVYRIVIDYNVLENFKDAKPLDKSLLLKMYYYEGSNVTTPTKEGECTYIITKVIASSETVPEWEISIKPDKNLSNDNKLDKDFPKGPKFYTKKNQYLQIRDKDGQSFKYLTPPPPPKAATPASTGGGCFLTTACVEQMQLADDCEALQSLRFLRDEHMKQHPSGQELVQQYQVAGPAVVNAINNCDNKAEIYEYMFAEMIQPSVQLVKAGRYQEAVEYYKTFVTALMKKYI